MIKYKKKKKQNWKASDPVDYLLKDYFIKDKTED